MSIKNGPIYPIKGYLLRIHFLCNSISFFFFLINFFIYFWPCWVFISVPGLSLVVASGGHSSSRCAGLSLSRPLFLRSTGSRRAGSVMVAHRPSCSAACGILPDQGSNSCIPALSGRFSTTAPPGKPLQFYFYFSSLRANICMCVFVHSFMFFISLFFPLWVYFCKQHTRENLGILISGFNAFLVLSCFMLSALMLFAIPFLICPLT